MLWGLLGLQLVAFPMQSRAQELRTVGFQLGQVRARQLWDGPFGTRVAKGVRVGVDVDVPTRHHRLSVRAGLAYTQRGSVVWDEIVDPDALTPANARSHYLSISIQGRLKAAIPGGAVYLILGPTIDQLLETECSADLCRLLLEERPTVLGVTVGSGVTFGVPQRLLADAEVRLTEGLTEAYRSGPDAVRYRSVEILLRIRLPV